MCVCYILHQSIWVATAPYISTDKGLVRSRVRHKNHAKAEKSNFGWRHLPLTATGSRISGRVVGEKKRNIATSYRATVNKPDELRKHENKHLHWPTPMRGIGVSGHSSALVS